MSTPETKEKFSREELLELLRREANQGAVMQPLVVEDINLDDPTTVEFAVYSSGGLDIYTDGCAIMLAAPVFDKLLALIERFPRAAK